MRNMTMLPAVKKIYGINESVLVNKSTIKRVKLNTALNNDVILNTRLFLAQTIALISL